MVNVNPAVMTFHEKYGQYDLGEGHPFRGERFSNAITYFRRHKLFNQANVLLVEPNPASNADLLTVHEEKYVDLIFNLAKEHKKYDLETPVSPQILEAALLVVGAAIKCGNFIFGGKTSRAISIGGGYHHAGRNYGGGFCLFNDIAVLVEHLRKNYDVKKILILDYDVHFGNGTSDIYYGESNVLFISLHQDPRTIYPGTGFTWQIGQGTGRGYNVNVPLPPGTGDATYLLALRELFVPLAEEFRPEIIIANGGSDSHFADFLGNLNLSVEGFFKLSLLLKETADNFCGGKLVLMLGSGYNPQVLPLCWYALIGGIVGLKENLIIKESFPIPKEIPMCRRKVLTTITELKQKLRKDWKCFT